MTNKSSEIFFEFNQRIPIGKKFFKKNKFISEFRSLSDCNYDPIFLNFDIQIIDSARNSDDLKNIALKISRQDRNIIYEAVSEILANTRPNDHQILKVYERKKKQLLLLKEEKALDWKLNVNTTLMNPKLKKKIQKLSDMITLVKIK